MCARGRTHRGLDVSSGRTTSRLRLLCSVLAVVCALCLPARASASSSVPLLGPMAAHIGADGRAEAMPATSIARSSAAPYARGVWAGLPHFDSTATYGYDSAPAVTTFLNFVATNTAGVVDDALAYATKAEKLDHIFVPKHNLEPLVQQLGSREAVVQRMLGGVKGLTPASGTFESPVTISGQTGVVRGAVVNGVVKLGTAFTP